MIHEPSRHNTPIEGRDITGQLDGQTDSQLDRRTLNMSNVSTENPQTNPSVPENGVQANINTLHNQHAAHAGPTDLNTCFEFAKIFAKEDLVSTIHLFDDNPENFSSWKASIKNAVRELGLSPSEAMNLPIQWLENTSSGNQEKSIRNANASNPH